MSRQPNRGGMRGGAATRATYGRFSGYQPRLPPPEQRPQNNGLINQYGQQENMDRNSSFATEFHSDFSGMDGDMYEQPIASWPSQPSQPSQPSRSNMNQGNLHLNHLIILYQDVRAVLNAHDRSITDLKAAQEGVEIKTEEIDAKVEDVRTKQQSHAEDIKNRVKQFGDMIATSMGDGSVDPTLTFPPLS